VFMVLRVFLSAGFVVMSVEYDLYSSEN